MSAVEAPLSPDAVLAARGISHFYGSLAAVQDVDIEVRRGEVVGLVGDNGAGKSTLLKLIAGAFRPDAGAILINGAEVELSSPRAAQQAGVATVFQDLGLVDEMSILDNL